MTVRSESQTNWSIIGFTNFNEVKAVYGSVSIVADDRVVFNSMGNKYRLVVRMVFDYKTIQIKWFGTLGKVGSKSYISAILNRHKPLTLEMAKFFHRELGIPAGVLLS